MAMLLARIIATEAKSEKADAPDMRATFPYRNEAGVVMVLSIRDPQGQTAEASFTTKDLKRFCRDVLDAIEKAEAQ